MNLPIDEFEMKDLKKFIALLLVGLVCIVAHAEFRWGPTVGVGFNNLKFKQDLFAAGMTVGPQVGLQGEMMFPGIGFGVDVGAYYSLQGGKMNLGSKPIWQGEYGNETSRLHTLSIPVDLRFKWTRMNGLEDIIAPYVFGGPVFDLHLGHNGIDAMDYSFCSIGLQAGFGLELFKRWQVQGSYVWGMTYAMKAVKLLDFSGRCSYWSVRVAYMF